MRFLCFVSSLLLVGCNTDMIYDADIPDEGWTYDNSLKYNIPLESDKTYSLDLEVLHTDDYGYQNLYVIVDLSSEGDYQYSDTLSIPLADSDGFWLGACRQSECAAPYSLVDNLALAEPAVLKATIGQYSRDEKLTGIKGVKLVLREKD
jgi:gliding motility-associated lipoprotein GldH